MENVLFNIGLQKNISEWNSNTSTDVNDPPSKSFTASPVPDGSMIVTNVGEKDFAGGLVSNKRPLPKLNGELLPYVAMRVRFLWNSAIYANMARHELDLKVCIKTRPDPNTKIRNVADFSTQWNRDTGQFQIDQDNGPDKIPTWIDTGYVVQDIAPDMWHTQVYNFWFNSEVYSVLSIQLDDNDPYMVPEERKNVLLSNTNWEEIASMQVQNELYKPGTMDVQYSNIDLAWSDAPMTGILPW